MSHDKAPLRPRKIVWFGSPRIKLIFNKVFFHGRSYAFSHSENFSAVLSKSPKNGFLDSLAIFSFST